MEGWFFWTELTKSNRIILTTNEASRANPDEVDFWNRENYERGESFGMRNLDLGIRNDISLKP